jgi:hypothetical protein
MRPLATAVLLLLGATAPALADDYDPEDRVWHTGLNLRTDVGTHRVRVDLGARLGRFDITAVLDPKVFIDHRQNDTDLLAELMFTPDGWAELAGWRLTQISIDRGRHFHHHLLLGFSAGLPRLFETIHPRFGFEFEANVMRHGSGLETDFIALSSERHYKDLLSVNLFLRLDYGGEI